MTEKKGWLKLHRELEDKAIWQNANLEQRSLLIVILMAASHKANDWEWQGKRFTVQPGQFITSLDSLAKRAKVSVRNVRTAIARFERLGFLTNESTKTGRLITVVNWGFYQGGNGEGDKADDSHPTNDRQSSGDVPPPVKKPKKAFVPPSVEEVAAYCEQRQNGIDPESFVAFYASKGWMVGSNKMADWKRAVITWERRKGGTGSNADNRSSPARFNPNGNARFKSALDDDEDGPGH